MGLKSLFKGHHEAKRIQVPRAILSAWLGAAIDYLIMIVMVEAFNIDELVSGTAGMLAGLTLVYFAGRLWIYPPVSGRAVGLEAVLYVVISAFGAGIHSLVLLSGFRFLKIHYLFIKSIASALMFCWNYSMRRCVNKRLRAAEKNKVL